MLALTPLKFIATLTLGLMVMAASALALIYASGNVIYVDLGAPSEAPAQQVPPATASPTTEPTATATTPTVQQTELPATATPTTQPATATAEPSATAQAQALDTTGPPFRLLLDDQATEISWDTALGFVANNQNGALLADRAALAEYAAAFAADNNRAAQRAAFRWNEATAQPEVVQESYSGLEVDEAALVEALAQALESGRGQDIAVPATVIAPEWSDAVLPILGDEIIGEHAIYYADNDRATVQNVEAGARALDGAISLPGAIFSHDAWVYDGTAYDASYAIVGDRTVLAPGGGLCIISTTLFQTAFWAGLPIVERHNHDYWISMYAMEKDGETYKGLDATVGDVRFRNSTGEALRVHAWTEGGWLYIQLIGHKPDWQVEVHSYEISNFIPAYETVEYFDEPSLPAGTTDISRNPHDGFDATITREVLENGVVIDTYEARSHYIATGQQILVGTGE